MCGVPWKGAIRSDDDNERMLGPKRLRREKLMYEHSPERTESPWLWAIETRDKERQSGQDWLAVRHFDPKITGACQVYNWLLWHRQDELGSWEEARISVVHTKGNYRAYGQPNVTTWNAQPHPSMKYGTQKEETNKEKSETVGKGH